METLSYLEVVEKSYLTPTEYASKYKLSVRTIYWQIKNGKRPYFVFKDKILIKDVKQARLLARYDHTPPYP